MKKGAIMQPTFNPWIGYFDLVEQTDLFVFYDDVQLVKRSWQVRNRIKTANGELFLTLPILKTKHRDDLLIMDAQFNNNEKWQKKHLKSLIMAYKKAAYFDEVYPVIESIYNSKTESLATFNIAIIETISQKMGIRTPFVRSSSLEGIRGDKDIRLTAVCKAFGIDDYLSPVGSAEYIEKESEGGDLYKNGIPVSYHHYVPVPYKQLHGEFVPNYGIFDLVFNVGFEEAKDIVIRGRKDSFSSKEVLNQIHGN